MLNIFSQNEIDHFVKKRAGEIKLGERILVVNNNEDFFEEVENTTAKFVIIGIPEDIGVKVNDGIGGTHTPFFPAMEAFLNTQENLFISGRNILALGYLDYLDTVATFVADDPEKSDYLVKQMDKDVSELIHFLISVGKIPIIIGGGQNNAYGNIKGMSTAKKQTVNVINFDTRTNLRRLEKRHNENSFAYALDDGYLDKYFMFGLHENNTPQYIFEYIHDHTNIDYNMFEEIEVYQSTSFESELDRAKNFIDEKPFGIEIDLSSLESFPSTNMTPTGFSSQQARRFIHALGNNKNACYLHISEGSPSVDNDSKSAAQVGKFISYLISDFIKSKTY